MPDASLEQRVRVALSGLGRRPQTGTATSLPTPT
jgi:hypothetical protein